MKPIVEIRNVHKVYTRGSEKLDVLQGVTVQVAASGATRGPRVAHGQGRARRKRTALGGESMRFLPFAFKSLSRNPVRATLTLLGVSVAMFLFTGVVSIDQGMRRMLANSIAPHVTLELAFLAAALAGVLGTIAAVLPAISASRLKIVQALREVD
jgi:hypothetical protein